MGDRGGYSHNEGECKDRDTYMTAVCKTDLCMFPTDDGASEPSEVKFEVKFVLVGPGGGHAPNIDNWGLGLVETKYSRDVFTCGYCEGETCE